MLDRVTIVVNFRSLGQQALASLGTTTVKDGASALRRHTGAKTELTLATTFGRLVSAFAHKKIQ